MLQMFAFSEHVIYIKNNKCAVQTLQKRLMAHTDAVCSLLETGLQSSDSY